MKKILYIIFVSCLLIGCSKDDEPDQQGYTSFVVWHNSDVNLYNSVAGYYTPNGKCIKLGDLGDLCQGSKIKRDYC